MGRAQRRAISALNTVGRRPPTLPSSATAPCSSLLQVCPFALWSAVVFGFMST